MKNESEITKSEILKTQFAYGKTINLKKTSTTRLIVNYSIPRATKDAYSRKRGLNRLDKQVKSGRLNKFKINHKGYNKYLKLNGDIVIEIDYDKYNCD